MSIPARFESIPNLLLHSVADRGVPNKERILIFAYEDVDLAGCGIMLGRQADAHQTVPMQDNLLWLGGGFLGKGDWLFVYTCPGTSSVTSIGEREKLISVYWGKTKTVLHAPEITPIVFRVGEANVLPAPMPPEPREQLGYSDIEVSLANSLKKKIP